MGPGAGVPRAPRLIRHCHCWCQKTMVIALSCGIKIAAVHCLVLSQSMRVADRQTDEHRHTEL